MSKHFLFYISGESFEGLLSYTEDQNDRLSFKKLKKSIGNSQVIMVLESESFIKIDTGHIGINSVNNSSTFEDHVVIISHIAGTDPEAVCIKNDGPIEDLIAKVSEFQFLDRYGEGYFDEIKDEYGIDDSVSNIELIQNYESYGIPDEKVVAYVDGVASSKTEFSGEIFRIGYDTEFMSKVKP